MNSWEKAKTILPLCRRMLNDETKKAGNIFKRMKNGGITKNDRKMRKKYGNNVEKDGIICNDG